MFKKYLALLIFFILPAAGCSNEPEPINFGTDQCDHCRMKIMDRKYGAELITSKGKIYKFDAAECMVNYLADNKITESDIDKILVINLTDPGNFTDANTAVYLISPKLKSPMGENISSFSKKNDAENFQNEYGGEIKNWEGIKNKLKGK